jgi:hypothetical protein
LQFNGAKSNPKHPPINAARKIPMGIKNKWIVTGVPKKKIIGMITRELTIEVTKLPSVLDIGNTSRGK